MLKDQFGDIIAITEKERTLFNYYRNNVLHLFAVPSVIAQQLFNNHRITRSECKAQVKRLYPLFAKEWFLLELKDEYIDNILSSFVDQGLIREQGDQLEVLKDGDNPATLEMLGKVYTTP